MTLLAAGQHIGDRYELERRIAIGGMGEVWEAADTRLGRSVAVKILRPELSDDDEFVQRFRIEARTVASLDHPGIAHVHDYGEDIAANGRHTAYLVMELVRGEPLSTIVARGPMEPDEALRIVEQAAWALHAAHERGYVHRDVKPGNILIGTDGRVKLTDFGIAKAANAVSVTRGGMVMGTAHYIAPEQATGSEAGPTGDVYSLGVVGYECLTGRRPFRGENAVTVAMMQVRDAPPPLPETLPLQIRRLIEAVLVKDPALRYSTGQEFAEAVSAVRRGQAAPMPVALGGSSTPGVRSAADGSSVAEGPAGADLDSVEPGAGSPPSGSATEAESTEFPAAAASDPGADPAAAGRSWRSTRAARTPDAPVTPRPSAGRPAPQQAPQPQPTPTPQPGSTERPPRAPTTVPTEPLRVTAGSSVGRTLLMVLFVLLTVAAVVLGYFVVIHGFGAAGPAPSSSSAGIAAPNRPTATAPAGSVAGREVTLAGRAASGDPGTAVWSIGRVR